MAAPVKRRELQREVGKNQRDDDEESIDESSGEENENVVAEEQVSTTTFFAVCNFLDDETRPRAVARLTSLFRSHTYSFLLNLVRCGYIDASFLYLLGEGIIFQKIRFPLFRSISGQVYAYLLLIFMALAHKYVLAQLPASSRCNSRRADLRM